jgi:hypothetical protein
LTQQKEYSHGNCSASTKDIIETRNKSETKDQNTKQCRQGTYILLSISENAGLICSAPHQMVSDPLGSGLSPKTRTKSRLHHKLKFNETKQTTTNMAIYIKEILTLRSKLELKS